MKQNEVASTLRVGLVGDFSSDVRAHMAIPQALDLAAAGTGRSIKTEWVHTQEIGEDVESRLATFNALWCVPGSPYASMEGALCAIRFARERGVPFLGTCGGFQHTLIEYARHVLGWSEADHAESNQTAKMPLVMPLSCSLVGARGIIELQEGSLAKAIYGAEETTEQYHCNFGFNPRYRSLFDAGALRITGVDKGGEVRVVELEDHPFFLATLFQPELTALTGVKHPLITAYVRAAAGSG
jgi:CTP synthase (UTP-ammonia lyase)